jgi:hypothetical protein
MSGRARRTSSRLSDNRKRRGDGAAERGAVGSLVMDGVLLAEAERVLAKHSPDSFDATIDAFPECVEYVRQVEDHEAWKSAYPSLESFYTAHEARHPLIRVYGEMRRRIETEDPFTSKLTRLTATEKLRRLNQELNG